MICRDLFGIIFGAMEVEEALGKLTDRMQIKREHGVSLLQSLLNNGGIHFHSYSLSKNLIFLLLGCDNVPISLSRISGGLGSKLENCTTKNIIFVLWEKGFRWGLRAEHGLTLI